MKYYLLALYKSFTSPSWLAAQAKQTKKSAWFFVLTVLVLSLGVSLMVTFRVIPDLTLKVKSVIEKEVPDFHATITDHQLSVTGVDQPYVRTFQTDGTETVVVVVDTVTTSTLSLQQFVTSSKKGILITKDQILTNSPDIFGSSKEDFSNVPNISFSRADALSTLGNIVGAWRPMIVILILTFTFLFWGLGLLLYLLICSSLIYLVYTRSTKQSVTARYTWKEVFTLSLFALALPKILVSVLTYVFFFPIPYLVTLAYVIAVFRALSIRKQLSEQQNDSDTSPLS